MKICKSCGDVYIKEISNIPNIGACSYPCIRLLLAKEMFQDFLIKKNIQVETKPPFGVLSKRTGDAQLLVQLEYIYSGITSTESENFADRCVDHTEEIFKKYMPWRSFR